MTQFATPGIGLNAGYPEGGDGWKAGADYNFVTTSIFLRRLIQNQTTGTLPGSPAIGDAFIAGGTLVGPLIGKDKWLVMRGELDWYYLEPEDGWRFFDISLGYWIEFDGTNWIVEEVDITAGGHYVYSTQYGAADIGNLQHGIYGICLIDMDGDDYTMTEEEGTSQGKVVVGGVQGKTLTWATAYENKVPLRQFVGMAFADPGVLFAMESGGTPVIYEAGNPFVQLTMSAASLSMFAENSTARTDFVVSASTFTFQPWHQGATYLFDAAGGCAVTIDPACEVEGYWVEVIQYGAAQVTFSHAALRNADGHTKTFGQYAKVEIRKGIGAEMVLSGRTGT